jgi:hypothetical protein
LTIQPTFHPYFPYHITIFFHISHIFSLFSAIFFTSFLYSTCLSSVFSLSFHYFLPYFSYLFPLFFHIFHIF